MEWILAPLKKYADFSGRARRKEFWLYLLAFYIVFIALYIPFLNDPTSPMIFVLGLYSLALLLPTIAVFVRRLHDVDKSGWWYLINFVPGVGGIILLIICIPEGAQGTNQYGPDPKAVPVG
ncbi:DUF805 domain-containing protein [Glycomyces niveus]|uniref:DUF805 domain-containing protein n=1 Tax=Glycomyces niveus TaxID=2820287 RepID=A0ABS3U1T8_9ACTN|nr:DUF805 domain-containing protein [Glycomyces sp. NEAU-S30]MBO3731718.1 DUF805 domain-containing protein [Glycomyces sp. NEAU-S30]